MAPPSPEDNPPPYMYRIIGGADQAYVEFMKRSILVMNMVRVYVLLVVALFALGNIVFGIDETAKVCLLILVAAMSITYVLKVAIKGTRTQHEGKLLGHGVAILCISSCAFIAVCAKASERDPVPVFLFGSMLYAVHLIEAAFCLKLYAQFSQGSPYRLPH